MSWFDILNIIHINSPVFSLCVGCVTVSVRRQMSSQEDTLICAHSGCALEWAPAVCVWNPELLTWSYHFTCTHRLKVHVCLRGLLREERQSGLQMLPLPGETCGFSFFPVIKSQCLKAWNVVLLYIFADLLLKHIMGLCNPTLFMLPATSGFCFHMVWKCAFRISTWVQYQLN